jgi:chromosome segregation ATPase
MCDTNNQLPTYSLKLTTIHQTLNKYKKKLVTIKGQLVKLQNENQNLSMRLNQTKQVARKVERSQTKAQ